MRRHPIVGTEAERQPRVVDSRRPAPLPRHQPERPRDEAPVDDLALDVRMPDRVAEAVPRVRVAVVVDVRPVDEVRHAVDADGQIAAFPGEAEPALPAGGLDSSRGAAHGDRVRGPASLEQDGRGPKGGERAIPRPRQGMRPVGSGPAGREGRSAGRARSVGFPPVESNAPRLHGSAPPPRVGRSLFPVRLRRVLRGLRAIRARTSAPGRPGPLARGGDGPAPQSRGTHRGARLAAIDPRRSGDPRPRHLAGDRHGRVPHPLANGPLRTRDRRARRGAAPHAGGRLRAGLPPRPSPRRRARGAIPGAPRWRGRWWCRARPVAAFWLSLPALPALFLVALLHGLRGDPLPPASRPRRWPRSPACGGAPSSGPRLSSASPSGSRRWPPA